MSTLIGISRGGLGFLAADTRIQQDGQDSDVGQYGIETPAGPKVLALADRRKMGPTPGPGWVSFGGGSLLQSRLALNTLVVHGVDRVELIREVLKTSSTRAAELVEEWGFSAQGAQVERDAVVGVGIIRPTPRGVDFRMVTVTNDWGGIDRGRIWPPSPLSTEDCDEVYREHMYPVASSSRSRPGDLLLGIAATLEGLREAGADSISGIAQVGVLLMGKDRRVRTAQVNFVNELLLQEDRTKLDERLRRVVMSSRPREGWDPEPVWLTERPATA